MKLKSAWLRLAGLLAISAFGQFAYASNAVINFLKEARSLCKPFDNGVLEFDTDRVIYNIDVTGNGQQDVIIDNSKIKYPTAPTLFCGTGGCTLAVIVNDRPFEFLAPTWKVEKAGDGKPLLKMAIHWSQCDYKAPAGKRSNGAAPHSKVWVANQNRS